jgi:hypothetical protein
MKTGLNNALLPTLFTVVNNIEQCCYTRFRLLLTSVNNVVSKTLFNPVKQRARRFLPCTRLKMLSLLFNRIEQCFAAHVVHACQLTILNNIVEPESGVTILFKIVDNCEQCGQQNIVNLA